MEARLSVFDNLEDRESPWWLAARAGWGIYLARGQSASTGGLGGTGKRSLPVLGLRTKVHFKIYWTNHPRHWQTLLASGTRRGQARVSRGEGVSRVNIV